MFTPKTTVKSKAKMDLTDTTLALVPLADGSGWADKARNAARSRVADMGLPIGRDEYWKYTDPKPFTNASPTHMGAAPASDVFAGADAVTITIADGVVQGDLPTVDGLDIQTLSDAASADIHWAQDTFGVLEESGQSEVERPLAALTTALARDGLVIQANADVTQPIRIVYTTTGAQVNVHHVIKVAPSAGVTVLEEGLAGARASTNMEVSVADGARFDHLRILPMHHDRDLATHSFARLGEGSTFRSFTLTPGGAMTRNEAVIEILGDNATAHIAGACLGDGNFHHDDTVFITHDAVDCESRQVFKKVLRNGATSVFQGKILVKPDAQKTDGYQISQSLLLDDDSQFLAKPELEIYADDVACSHGSTSGAIDEEALFYLRSRGVAHGTAVDLLTLSFLAEAIEEIADDTLADIVLAQLEETLSARR